jgi:hypothetical protein
MWTIGTQAEDVIGNKEGRAMAAPFIPFIAIASQAAFIAFLRSAQRFFIISEMRLLAAALKRRRPRLPVPAAAPGPRPPEMDPRRAEIACSSRSLSASNSEIICCVSI